MKRTIKIGVMGLLLAAGVAQSNAQSNWVQAANVSLSVVAPAGKFTLTSAEIVVALGGLVGTNGLTTTTTLSTNTSVSAVAATDVNVTNDATFALSTNSFVLTNIFGTNGALVFSTNFANFPASLTATGITFQTLTGTNVATNQSITLSLVTNGSTPAYTFNNLSGSNAYAYTNSFAITNSTGTNLPADYISAVLLTNSTTNQLIFSLEYSTLVTNVTTNTVSVGNVVTNPAFVKANKLVLYSPLAGSTNLPKFGVLTGTSKAPVLNDISGFLYLTSPAGAPSFALKGTTYTVQDLVLAAGSTGSFTAEAAVDYTVGNVKIKSLGETLSEPKSSTANVTGFGSFNLGTLGENAAVVTGKVTTSGGGAL